MSLPAGESRLAYQLLLPPGWVRLPVREANPAAITRLLDRMFAHQPRDQVAAYRRRMERLLSEQVAAARRHGGLDLFLPVERVGGRTVAASFVVAEVAPQGADTPERAVADLVGRAAGDARPVEIAGARGARFERVQRADPDRQRLPRVDPADPEVRLDRDTRRVDYVLRRPDGAGWLVVSLSTAALRDSDQPMTPAGVRFDDLVVELFDAIVSTLRWEVR